MLPFKVSQGIYEMLWCSGGMRRVCKVLIWVIKSERGVEFSHCFARWTSRLVGNRFLRYEKSSDTWCFSSLHSIWFMFSAPKIFTQLYENMAGTRCQQSGEMVDGGTDIWLKLPVNEKLTSGKRWDQAASWSLMHGFSTAACGFFGETKMHINGREQQKTHEEMSGTWNERRIIWENQLFPKNKTHISVDFQQEGWQVFNLYFSEHIQTLIYRFCPHSLKSISGTVKAYTYAIPTAFGAVKWLIYTQLNLLHVILRCLNRLRKKY